MLRRPAPRDDDDGRQLVFMRSLRRLRVCHDCRSPRARMRNVPDGTRSERENKRTGNAYPQKSPVECAHDRLPPFESQERTRRDGLIFEGLSIQSGLYTRSM